MMLQMSSLIAAFLLIGGKLSDAYYHPGVNPNSFAENAPVKLKVNKMTSSQTLLPIDYYRLPFCAPHEGVKMENENLGEFLAGDRIENSPYQLFMKVDLFCHHLCITNLGPPETKGRSPSMLVKLIRKNYHNNWIVDNLSSASKVEDEKTITTRYWQGFPIGFINVNDKRAYIHNHVNLELEYHAVETENNKYRIVRFTVEPFSIKHDIEEEIDAIDAIDDTLEDVTKKVVAKIKKPIASCIPGSVEHTSYDMVTAAGREQQLAHGKVLFTYDVKWTENKELKWASRWDIYLSMDGAIPAKVHWHSIEKSLVIVLVLSAMIAAILVRTLRLDFAQYNRLAMDEEKEDELEKSGWKSVHADVFRPPSFSPRLLAVFCGTGAQILFMSFFTIVFSAFGFLSPANRGALLIAELLLFVLMGSVNGYVTARLYKTFIGKESQRATMAAALGFPGLSFAFFFLMDVIAWGYKSTVAVPFVTMLVIIVLWFGISTPLVFLGAYFGYKADAIEFPVNTSSIPRQIPDQPWYTGIPFTLAIGGIVPFAACFVELHLILNSVWMDHYYYVFGFLFLVYVIVIVTCAEITILFTYFQLSGENYRWWWRSFCTAGSTALFVFFYSFVYFRQLHASTLPTYILYFGYMSLTSFGLFVMMGFVGLLSSLIFNQIIFGSIKVSNENSFRMQYQQFEAVGI